MANETSSVNVQTSNCHSGPHTSTATSPEEEARLRDQRLSSVTVTSDDFKDRLLGQVDHDHEAYISQKLAALAAQISSTSTTDGTQTTTN
ncbi:hypothetical protein GGR54DRAFT_436458 [Hypoxylon sp. NC1633]|nr:hypothetical protein GGR54DRAFT_436458 [Hypoxylon sp. NC1633]